MKELLIEEKDRRYELALERCRKLYNEAKANGYTSDIEDYETIFPELKESKDEKIRKRLIELLKKNDEQHYAKEIAWLEKQGEQSPAWSDEDETGLGDALWAIQQARTIAKNENDMGNLWYAERWLKSLKDRVQPKQEWSEEDEKMIENIIDTINMSIEDCDVDDVGTKARFTLEKERDWLKSLSPQNTWKPSEEQMKALTFACIKNAGIDKSSIKALYDLKEQLKKLREE